MAESITCPALVIDLAGYSSLTEAEVRVAMDRVVSLLDESAKPLFGRADPWSSLRRWNTGDGYYVLLRGLGPHDALWFAREFDTRLAAETSPDADALIRLRMVLGLGAVEEIGDRFEGKVLTEMGRLLDGPVLRQSLKEAAGKTALAATPEFHAAWQLDPVRKEEGWIIEPANWSKYEDKGKRGEIWPGWLFGQSLPDLTSPVVAETTEPDSPEPIRIVAFVAHSLDEPLPAALHWATVLVNLVKGSGLNIELRLAPASRGEMQAELARCPDLVLFYGHGDEQGRLLLIDGAARLSDLAPANWRGLKGCILFASHSARFAVELECPFVGFDQQILQSAPNGFVEALFAHWPELPFSEAIDEGFALCSAAMTSDAPEAAVKSAEPFGALAVAAGTSVLSRGTPRQLAAAWTDYGEIEDGQIRYPEHEPFVGRHNLLRILLHRTSRFGDGARVTAHWVTGSGGIGKTALTRELVRTTMDAAFVEPDDPLWVEQMNCYSFTDAGAVQRRFAGRLVAHHELAEDGDIDRVSVGLAARGGEHLWVLDDLTYLAARPDDTAPARRLVDTLAAAAERAGLRARIVVTSRQGDGAFPNLHALEPLDWPEAAEMALRMAAAAGLEFDLKDMELGARRLHYMAKGRPALYKRALKQAAETKQGYRARADAMAASLGERPEDMELDALARAMTEFEIASLAGLEEEHGFAYRRFLSATYDLFRRAGGFDRDELAGWFAEAPLAASPQAYQRGLLYLLHLGFLALEERDGKSLYMLPPNQRQLMQARRDDECDLSRIPFREPGQALSMAIERAGAEGLAALGDFDDIRRAYAGDLSDAGAAAAVIVALNVEVEARRFIGNDLDNADLEVYNEILSIAERYRESWSTQSSSLAAEEVARCLLNIGFVYGQLKRPEEAIEAYKQLVTLYGDRPEAAIAVQVARGLVNMGIPYGQLERPEEAIEACEDVVRLYKDRPEAAIAECVARGLVNMGITYGRLERPEEEIEAYERVVTLYGNRPEAAIEEQVAKAIVAASHALWSRGQSGRALAYIDRLEALYGDRTEENMLAWLALAEAGKSRIFAQNKDQDQDQDQVAPSRSEC